MAVQSQWVLASADALALGVGGLGVSLHYRQCTGISYYTNAIATLVERVSAKLTSASLDGDLLGINSG